MTDNTQELDEILSKLSGESFDAAVNNPDDYMQVLIEAEKKAKQAILDWHNKQVEAVLDGLELNMRGKTIVDTAEGWQEFFKKHVNGAIEAERNKLKEAK